MTAKLAVVFPGQGSQSVGMLDELASRSAVVRESFSEASDALGVDLWKLVSAGPKEELDLTQNTQPAMLAAGVAAWRLWKARGGTVPAWMAGHSLGEYSALVCAGALGFADGVRLVAERGRLMQDAVPEGAGAVAAVLGLADEDVRAACAQAAEGQVVEAVNFNAPEQVVVAGHAEAVSRAVGIAKRIGAKRAIVLPVSVPVHCALMRSAAERLGERLAAATIRPPSVPVLHNVSVHGVRPRSNSGPIGATALSACPLGGDHSASLQRGGGSCGGAWSGEGPDRPGQAHRQELGGDRSV